MKSVLKLMLLITLMTMSLKGFSQNAIKKSSRDSIKIQLTRPIAKLVIKDLIIGDGVKKELNLVEDKTKILQQKIVLKDSIIFNLDSQIHNFNSIISTKSNQLLISQELSKKLQVDLKKQKFKNKLTLGGGIVAVIITALIVK